MRRVLLNVAYVVRRFTFKLLRWSTRGVRVMAFDPEGRLLLVRHGYGRRELWMLPGGGIGRRETPDEAARRELMEEARCGSAALTSLGEYRSTEEGRLDTVFLFRGETRDEPQPDRWEVEEARFFALDALPSQTSPATLRRIAELRGLRKRDSEW